MKQYQVFEMPIPFKEHEKWEDWDRACERILTNKESPRLVILRGGIGEDNPKSFMDDVVSEYTKDYLHNHFIEHTLDNPYVRILIFGINDIGYEIK